MYLSRLEVFGFKSFARKTNIDFHDGITAIVGPNGCGKSNVVDAIRWVLGEQRAGTLRSENMQNVIFNGTRSQKPLGMAEVSLTIQNNHNVLPIQYSEVVITRRLFRSGESQYLLNQSPCRLKDILDLFMDTGMGLNAYSVIELSMVEKILNGKPEERRQIFEEAAGVTKYKIRRKAAYRKLDATEQDLIRLSDIVSEVEKTTNSLRRQVNKATRYRDYSQELRQLELDYSAFNFAKIQNELKPLEVRSKEVISEKEQISSELATQEAEVEKRHVELLELERQLNARGSTLSANQQRIREKEEEILVCQERINALRTARQRASREIDELHERTETIAAEKEESHELLSELQSELSESESKLQQARSELNNVQQIYSAKRAEGKEQEAARLQHMEEIAKIQQSEERLRTHQSFSSERAQAIENERNKLDGQIKSLEQKSDEMAAQKQMLTERVSELEEELATTNRDLELAREQVEQSKGKILELQGEIKAREDRANLLRKVLESYEDYPEGVRYLLRGQQQQAGYHGTLGDLLSVEDQYRRAVEVALGESAVAVIVDGARNAVEAIDMLKSQQKGAVTFLPIERFSENGKPAAQTEGLPDGIVGWAGDLVQVKPAFQNVVSGLLAKVLVVDTLDSALEIAPLVRRKKISIVTLDGEVVHESGAIRGGHSGDTAAHKLGRKTMIEKLVKEIAQLEKELGIARDALEKQNERVRDRMARTESLQAEQKSSNVSLQNVEIAFGQANGDLQRAKNRRSEIDEEQASLSEQASTLRSELENIQPRLVELAKKKSDIEAQYQDFQNQLITLEEQVREKEQAVQNIHLDFVKKQGAHNNQQQNIERLIRNAREVETAIERRKEEIVTAQNQSGELEERTQVLRENLQDDFAERKELEEVLEEINRQHREIKEVIDGKEKALKSVRSKRDQLSDDLHRMELRISELRMNAANLTEHIRENYETELKTHPAPEELDTKTSAERINDLKQKIRAIGPVNMLALKDYEVEKERLDFLMAQKADLLEAEENLKETIRVINNNAYERFNAVFSKVRENFIEVFKSFFENGAADLRLAEDDPLESEIIIEASPKGKKLGSLALLSGGEKTLTAISLLFAIYLVKPSPFCVLDEVDAPLDDANIRRFSNALDNFSDRTQFIVVTHNKLTMNSARQLYGITMEEPGISKVVSVKFDEIAQQNAPAATA